MFPINLGYFRICLRAIHVLFPRAEKEQVERDADPSPQRFRLRGAMLPLVRTLLITGTTLF